MKLLLLLGALACAQPLAAQELQDLRPMKRVRLFTADSVYTGDWMGVRDSVAGVSQQGTLRSIPLTRIDSLQVFQKQSGRVALASGLVLGTAAGIVLGGGLGALLGAMLGSGVGKWQSYYHPRR